MNPPTFIAHYHCSPHTPHPEPDNNGREGSITDNDFVELIKLPTISEVSFKNTPNASVWKCEVIKKPKTILSKAKRLLSRVPTALCIPLRVCTTLLSVGMFAGYYVTVMTVTALATLTALPAKIKAHISSSPAEKPLKEYAVSHARKVFKWLALPYEHLPDKFKGSIFPVMSGAALFLIETLAIPIKRLPITVYEKVCSTVYRATKPYKRVTDMTVRLFDVTKKFIGE